MSLSVLCVDVKLLLCQRKRFERCCHTLLFGVNSGFVQTTHCQVTTAAEDSQVDIGLEAEGDDAHEADGALPRLIASYDPANDIIRSPGTQCSTCMCVSNNPNCHADGLSRLSPIYRRRCVLTVVLALLRLIASYNSAYDIKRSPGTQCSSRMCVCRVIPIATLSDCHG